MKQNAALLVASMVCFGSALQAGPLLLDRGLPTANLNNTAGSDRSNVAWGEAATDGTFNWTYGDDFTIGTAGQSYQINDLTVWVVGDADHDPLSSIFSSLTLSGGALGTDASASAACATTSGSGQGFPCLDASGVTNQATVNTDGTDPAVSVTSVTYDGSQTYQGNSGAFRDLYEVTFQNLAWNILGGQTYTFFVSGVPGTTGNGGNSPFLSASNAALSGSPQDGSDGLAWELAQNSSTTAYVAEEQWSSLGNGWDKASDINVQIGGTETPEPATLGIFAAGLGLLGILRRRKVS